MKLFPNCKINLGLRVIRKREDGYHDLETVFVPIYGLHDELEVLRNDKMSAVSPLNDATSRLMMYLLSRKGLRWIARRRIT